MSDGISDGLGRPMNERELRDALEEAQRFGQYRTNEVVQLSAEVERLKTICRCPFLGCGGGFEKSPHGPADTFTCNSCGAVVLPGRKP